MAFFSLSFTGIPCERSPSLKEMQSICMTSFCGAVLPWPSVKFTGWVYQIS